jgi:hypothetical protein
MQVMGQTLEFDLLIWYQLAQYDLKNVFFLQSFF